MSWDGGLAPGWVGGRSGFCPALGCLLLFPPADETEYEYSGSEEEDDGRGEEGEPRYGGQRGGFCSFWSPLGKECQACRLALWQLTDPLSSL